MYLRRDHFERTVRAPAKLNLYLEVLGRRADGFHDVETLIVPIRIWDSLSMARIPESSEGGPGEVLFNVRDCLSVIPPRQPLDIPLGAGNLVVRALELLRQRSGCDLGTRVELVKRIPSSAGLGGGSSDAAAALILANQVWELGWSPGRLRELAAELGSDVSFFLSPGAGICRGRGELVEKVNSLRALHFVVVKPPAELSTAEVYHVHDSLTGASRRSAGRVSQVADALSAGRRPELGAWLHNGLQSAAAALSPWIDRLRSIFDGLDFVGHQLSGSGSAYFGVCRHARHSQRLAAVLRARQLGLVYTTRSCA